MHLTTTARHFTLEPADRAHAQERLERLARFVGRGKANGEAGELHLIVTAEKHAHTAEVTLRVLRRELVSREEAEEARVAIDLAASNLEQRLRRLKERVLERRRGGRARAVELVTGTEATPDDDSLGWFDDAPAEA